MMRSQPWMIVCLALVLTACGRNEAEREASERMAEAEREAMATRPPSEPTTMPPGAAAGALTDGNITAILTMADSAEIRPSQVAQQRAQNARVKEFAQMMVRDHGMLEDSLRAMAQRLSVTPAPDSVSRRLLATTDSVVRALQPLNGAAFDSAYMAWMVNSHQATLNALDQQVIPAARNPELKTALERMVRPQVEQHLQQARQIQSSLGGAR